ncbi:hypothetical protein N7540_006566 [Penicillium herquei]|nr:hypothetical protein N7540_006566 [Penicillium herquei]
MNMNVAFFRPHESSIPAFLAIFGLISFYQSFRYHPVSATKDLISVLSLVLAEILKRFGWLRTFTVLLPGFVMSTAGILFAWILSISCFQRNLILWSEGSPETEKSLLGRPLFFPCRLTHARMFPERYSYGIDYFLVGIPVGLRGRVGALISIDNDGSDLDLLSSKSLQSFMRKLSRRLCWFSVDPGLYLYRGDIHLSLTQKLEHFLKTQGEDPSQYPYAYLISIPQFFWWTKSPISYWYLYSPTKELSAVIMEINNSYGEKKNALFRVTREESSSFDEGKFCKTFSTVLGKTQECDQTVRFLSSIPIVKYYKGNWDKDIFASPFEKVEGGFKLRFIDPLDPTPAKGGEIHSNMTLMSVDGKPKISSRLFSCGPALDPLLSSSWEVMIFLLSWSFVIPSSIGRIVVEALRIRFRGNLPYLNKPDVKQNNIPRNASGPERVLEPFFRMYLSKLVDQCQFPLKVIYTPAKSLHLHPMTMNSSVKTLTSAPTPALMIQPLTPQFYTNIVKHSDAKSGFALEYESLPRISDPVSQRVWISDLVLLQKLIDSGNTTRTSKQVQSYFTRDSSPQRKARSKTFMDEFTDSHCSIGMRRTYRAARFQCYLAENLAWGSYKLISIYGLLLRLIIMWLICKGILWMQCNAAAAKFEDKLTVSGICFALVCISRALIGYLY